MSKKFKVIFAALAVSGTLGAVQLASGHDLSGLRQLASTAPVVSDVNRTGKTDRGDLRTAHSQTETVTIRNVGLEDTSVVVRVPVSQTAQNRPSVPAKPAASNKPSKTAVACEPPVSVLTEVAKLLQPGRCVT